MMGSPLAKMAADQLRASLPPEQRHRFDAASKALTQASGKKPSDPGYMQSLKDMGAIEKMLIYPKESHQFNTLLDLDEFAEEQDLNDRDYQTAMTEIPLTPIYKAAQQNTPAVVVNPKPTQQPYRPRTAKEIATQRVEKLAAKIPTTTPTVGPVIRRAQDRVQFEDSIDLPEDVGTTTGVSK